MKTPESYVKELLEDSDVCFCGACRWASGDKATSLLINALQEYGKACIKDYEEKLWAACNTDEDSDALARILYKASVPARKTNNK